MTHMRLMICVYIISALLPMQAYARCENSGRIWLGMTREQVFSTCLGKPKHINTTITAAGRREQLIYPGGYVYLDNGVVSGIQTLK